MNSISSISFKGQCYKSKPSFSAKNREYSEETSQISTSSKKPLIYGALGLATVALIVAKRKNIGEFLNKIKTSFNSINIDGCNFKGKTQISPDAVVKNSTFA